MTYQLNSAIKNLEEKGKFVNAAGNTECVEFVRQACRAPRTTLWKKGLNVGTPKVKFLKGPSTARSSYSRA